MAVSGGQCQSVAISGWQLWLDTPQTPGVTGTWLAARD